MFKVYSINFIEVINNKSTTPEALKLCRMLSQNAYLK